MKARIYVNRDGTPKLESGEWAWVLANEGDTEPWQLAFGCPCGNNCGGGSVVHNSYIAVVRGPSSDAHQWEWDGDWDAPTLTPSIQRRGACEWHGFMVKGKFCLTPDG